MHSVSALRRPAGTLLGCVLAVCSFVSASAQSAGSETQAAIAPSSISQAGSVPVRDRWDAIKVNGSATDASRATVTASKATPAGSRDFVQKYVTEKLTVWQQRLKLNEWCINWAMARRSDLKPNTVGQIHWDKPSKRAAILVLDPSDYRMPFNAMLDDMELTIIHELVHLKLTALPHSEASRGSEEQAVNGISEALSALEHQNR